MIKRYSHTGFVSKSSEAPLNELLPVLTAEQLLASEHRQGLLTRIQRLASAPTDHYQALYANLINTFAAFVQQLPHADHSDFSLLDYHLSLCDTALALRIPFLSEDKTWNIAQQQEALWHYVIFSSAMLQNIGRLVTRYSVALCNDKGHFVNAWEPFFTSMNEQPTTHYRVQQILLQDPVHTPKVSQLLAMHLMPRDGFLWIASDPDALAAWLEAVEGQAGSGGIIMRLLTASEKELFKRAREKRLLNAMRDTEHLEHLAQKLDVASHEVLGMAPPLHGKLSTETAIGEAFYNWLKNGLHDGSIAVNTKDAMVHRTEDGVFLLYPPIFEAFCKVYPRYRDWAVVYRQFNYLGLAPLSGSDFVFAKYFAEHPDVTTQKEAQRTATQASQAPIKFLQSSLFKSALSAEHNVNPAVASQGAMPIAQAAAATTAAAATAAGLLVDPKFLFPNHNLPSISTFLHIHHPMPMMTNGDEPTPRISEATFRQLYDIRNTSPQVVTTFFTRLQSSLYPALRFVNQNNDLSAFYGMRNSTWS